jgi:nicotinamide-nucleotide amidase
MTRTCHFPYRIALLATGDEIARGDITNTNSQEIAHQLTAASMEVRLHMTAPDTIAEIEQAIQFLLASHHAIIITGGLGPTSDDLTRIALSQALEKPLVFDETAWQSIVQRLKKLGVDNPPESNRQQAFFPKDAAIIANPHGTAAGCMVQHQEKFIFMLPGPPSECLPMIETIVLPTLKNAGFSRNQQHQHWLLFGVSEGKIAQELDAIVKPYGCTTGYRLFYPYLEFKLYSDQQIEFLAALTEIEKAIAPYLLGNGQQTASASLTEKIINKQFTFTICDHATGGALESILKTPATHTFVHFATASTDTPRLEINGLTDFWQGKLEANITDLGIKFYEQDYQHELLTEIPMRGKRVIPYAVEYICHEINLFLDSLA